MILVDTSVWIEFLQGRPHAKVDTLKSVITHRRTLLYTEMILLELLQGIARKEEREEIEKKFGLLLLVPQRRSATMLAAEIYQELRRQGITIRSVVDCLIAATAIETGASVLHKDRDFDKIAEFYPVRLE